MAWHVPQENWQPLLNLLTRNRGLANLLGKIYLGMNESIHDWCGPAELTMRTRPCGGVARCHPAVAGTP